MNRLFEILWRFRLITYNYKSVTCFYLRSPNHPKCIIHDSAMCTHLKRKRKLNWETYFARRERGTRVLTDVHVSRFLSGCVSEKKKLDSKTPIWWRFVGIWVGFIFESKSKLLLGGQLICRFGNRRRSWRNFFRIVGNVYDVCVTRKPRSKPLMVWLVPFRARRLSLRR